MKTEVPPQSCCLLRHHRKLNTRATRASVRTSNLRPIAILSIDFIHRQRAHGYTIHLDGGMCIRGGNDHFERLSKEVVRGASGIQVRLPGSRLGAACRD